MRLPAVRADMLHPSITATVRKFLIQGDSRQLFALAKDARQMHYKVSHASC